MAKNIVFCADGTWNGPGEADNDDSSGPPSNVFKLFLNLAGADTPDTALLAKEQERMATAADGSVVQVAKYLHGVGDSGNFLDRMIGGAIGTGLITRVVRGYTFVSRHYQPGDRIYLVGFSRGAYTARALAGLISAEGLLDASRLALSDRNASYRLGAAVWYAWRADALAVAGHPIDHLQAIVADLPAFLSQPPTPLRVAAPIAAVAVWDTVGALGIPEFSGQMTAIDAFQFADTRLSPNVAQGRHAISIDEQRANFTPTFWIPDENRIVQALFPGAHADVGGGYPTVGNESGLSDFALQWMGKELAQLGVRFAPNPAVALAPDPTGTAHQPWRHGIWQALPHRPRDLPPGLGLSQSAIDRINAGPVVPDPGLPPVNYVPGNLGAYLSAPPGGVPGGGAGVAAAASAGGLTAAAAGIRLLNGSRDWP